MRNLQILECFPESGRGKIHRMCAAAIGMELVATLRRDDISKEKIWRAVGYAPLLVLRQYRSRQFIPVTRGLAQCEFTYRDDNYKKRVREISNAWNQTGKMKIFATNPMTTP
ncbi:hypothetical protein J1N35_028268 [Gossypium stocksii]|uniref:Uncharacterized protein n=1 Tax=Gossypium stocksii TaxID=47602 RepID=A0A9D3UVX1_9ROSI|nr:hypothetical protein J1N35_028268 [Gossypium stocksii]